MNIQDTTETIMLHLDFKSLKSLCLSSSFYNHLCNNDSFWIKKFQQHNLTLFRPYPTTLKGWIDEYDAVTTAAHLLLINQIELEHENNPKSEHFIIIINDVLAKYKTVNQLPLSNDLIQQLMDVDETDDMHFSLVYNQDTNYSFSIFVPGKINIARMWTYDQVIQLLKTIIRDNRKRPRLTIEDNFQIPYLYTDLKRKYTKHYEYLHDERDDVRYRKMLWMRLGL